MNDFIKFLKDIFMIQEAAPMNVGLSQFKIVPEKVEIKEEKSIKSKDIKLSDLMRRS